MKKISALAVSLVLLIIGADAFGQSETLAVTANKPVVDGVINPGEYSLSADFKDLVLYVSRSADALYVAVVGNTTGWVAFGLGSELMDGATIFMGFVQKDGKVQFKPQAGREHGHRDTTKNVTDSMVSYAMKEAGGKTTLEVQLKPAAYITSGQALLDMIYAEGAEDSFLPRHTLRGSLSLKVSK